MKNFRVEADIDESEFIWRNIEAESASKARYAAYKDWCIGRFEYSKPLPFIVFAKNTQVYKQYI